MTQRPHVKGSYANGFKKGRPAPLVRKFSGKRKQRVKPRRKTIARRKLGKYLPASTGGKNVPNLGTYLTAKETGGKNAPNLGTYSSAKETGGNTASNLGRPLSTTATGGTTPILGIYEYELCSVDFRNFLNNFEYTDDTSMKKVNL